MEPLVSFIITDYNLPATLLKECINSVLAIALKPEEREIILIDDGSDVPSADRLGGRHDHITYIRQDNAGLSVARNTGMEHASGKYIQFVDGDDCLIKKGYDIIVSELRKDALRQEQTDILLFKESRTAVPGWNPAIALKLFRNTSGGKYLTKKNIRASACGYAFRKETLGNLRFVPGVYHEDEEFTPMLMSRAGRVTYTSAKAYYYRIRQNSITLTSKKEHIEKRFHDILQTILRLRLHSETGGGILNRRVHQLTMDYVYQAIKTAGSYDQLLLYTMPLHEQQLVPLSLHAYTAAYFIFALVSRSETGLKILFKLLG